MVWLVIAEGLPIGSWRIKIGHSGICLLCDRNVIQNPDHAFFSCPAVSNAWAQMRSIRATAGKTLGLTYWEEVIYSNLGRPLLPRREAQTRDTL
jgi:hypothetical protein